MKEEKLEQLTNYLLSTVKDTVEFTKEQAPDVVKQMLVYDVWEASMWFYGPLVMIGLTTLGLVISGAYSLISEEKNSLNGGFFGFLTGVCGLALVISILTMPLTGIPAYFKLNKIEKAPKYYLIEKIRGNE